MEGERVLYPCYFNESLTRSEGRRIKKAEAVKNPSARNILAAAKKMGLDAHSEEKSHPGEWLLKEGRVIVKWEKSKEILIHKIAEQLNGKN